MGCSIDIRTINDRVVLTHDGLCVGMPWEGAFEFFDAVNQLARFSREYSVHKNHALVQTDRETVCQGEITIYRTGLEFVFLLNGHSWFTCPWTAALAIARQVRAQGANLEEVANHERTVEDAALLMRTGLPIGITSNKKILKEALKQAEDVEFPGMVEPQFVIHAPTIIMSPPSQENENGY